MTTPVLTEARFSNGLSIIHLYTQNDPISACHLLIPGGTDREMPAKAGVTTLMWSLLNKGTKKRTARQIAEDVESIGASVGAGATHDYSEVSCHVISEYFREALRVVAELLFEPGFSVKEVEKERAALIEGIRSKRESIFTVANEQLNHFLYGEHPYAYSTSGTEKSVAGLTAEDVKKWHKQTLRPNDAIFSIASNISFDQIKKELEGLFGPTIWKKQKIDFSRKLFSTAPIKKTQTFRLLEKFEQAYLLIGYAAPKVASKDYVPLKILNACLGGGMSARLFQQLREQEGLAYDVGSFYASKKRGSAFVAYMGLQPSKLEDAKARILKALNDVRTKKIPNRELNEVKNYIKGTFILDHQTNSQRAHYLGWWKILGLGSEYDRQYIKEVDKVSGEDVLRVAKKILGTPSVTVEVFPKKLAEAK